MKINLGRIFRGGGEAKEGPPAVQQIEKQQPDTTEKVPQLDNLGQVAEKKPNTALQIEATLDQKPPSEIATDIKRANETSSPPESELGKVYGSTISIYRKIAEALSFATGKTFQIDIEGVGSKVLDVRFGRKAFNVKGRGDGDWSYFERVKQAACGTENTYISWDDATTRKKVQGVIDEQIIQIEKELTGGDELKFKELLRKKLDNPFYLPTHQEIATAFEDDEEGFKAYYDNPNYRQFEVFTREFIDSLSNYLYSRVNTINPTEERITVLEVGAGNGRLSYFLNKIFREEKRDSNVIVIATDSGQWHEQGIKPLMDVREENYQDALKNHNPDIVLCCWMPPGVDWTPAFRDTESVNEYILFGNKDHTGKYGETWEAPYRPGTEEEYFIRAYRDSIKNQRENDQNGIGQITGQICRNDVPPFDDPQSRTASFTRRGRGL